MNLVYWFIYCGIIYVGELDFVYIFYFYKDLGIKFFLKGSVCVIVLFGKVLRMCWYYYGFIVLMIGYKNVFKCVFI